MVSVAFKKNLKEKYGIKFNNENLLEDALLIHLMQMNILEEKIMKS